MLRSTAIHRPWRWAKVWPSLRRSRPAWINLFIPFAALIVLSVGLTGWLALRNGQQAVTQLVERYEQEVVSHIERDLAYRLSIPHRINRNNVTAVDLGLLDFDDPDLLERYFWHELQQNPEVNYISAGNASGGLVGVGRNGNGELRRYRTENFTRGEYGLYRMDEDGIPQEQIDTEDNYDARDRPWYEAAADKQERWSEIYRYVGEPFLGIAASTPVVDSAGQLRGVMATDLELTQISTSLRNILNTPESLVGSRLIVLERSGDLVATSTEDEPFTRISPGEGQQRRHARDSADAVTRNVYQALLDRFGDLAAIQQTEDLIVTGGGQRQLVHITPCRNSGLDWLIALVMPEQAFMVEIHRNTRNTAALCGLAVIGAVLLSMAIARRMSHPLWQLSEASRALSQGQFDRQLPPYRTRELNVLSSAFNRMVHRLRDLFAQLEDRNALLEQRVKERTAHLTQANYQLKLLLRSVSHDLRNPLMGMLMVLNGIREQDSPDSGPSAAAERREIRLSSQALNTLISSGERQLRLVNSLLEDSAIDEVRDTAPPPDVAQVAQIDPLLDKRQPALVPCSLQHVIAQVEQDVQPLLLRHQATLTTAVPQSIPPVLADGDQLWRVIENLISNAIAHNHPGIHITIAADVITTARTGPTVCCKVIDDGAGIALDQQQHLFDPYRQGRADSPGLGLGLYICRRIVEAHGGTIGVLSQPGAGATFWFIIPVA